MPKIGAGPNFGRVAQQTMRPGAFGTWPWLAAWGRGPGPLAWGRGSLGLAQTRPRGLKLSSVPLPIPLLPRSRCSENPPEHLRADTKINEKTSLSLTACPSPPFQVLKPSSIKKTPSKVAPKVTPEIKANPYFSTAEATWDCNGRRDANCTEKLRRQIPCDVLRDAPWEFPGDVPWDVP